MPMYEYQCKKHDWSCGLVQEFLLPPQPVEPPVCPRCGDEMVRIISAPARIIVRNNRIEKKRYEG